MLAILFVVLAKLLLIIFKSPPMEISEIEIAKILFNIPALFYRILGLLVLVFSSYLFALISSRAVQSKSRLIFFISFLLFFLSPWQNLISTFLPIPNVLILVLLLIIYLKPKFKIITLIVLVFISLLYFSSTEKDYLFVNSLKPSKLGFEINERQKIDFLAVNKKFILPSLFRKITYNKPILAFNKIIGHFISFFDFDYWASPVNSYAIIRLSGYSPKGNIPLVFLWEIPLIILGIFLYKDKKKTFVIFLIALIPYLVFETKILPKTAFLASPILLFLEVYAISKINLKGFSFNSLALIIVAFSLFTYYKFFFFEFKVYQTPQPFYFKEVSSWIKRNQNSYQNFIVSPLFGPIEKSVLYYLGKNDLNISFNTFDLKKNYPKPNTIYIGLVGEFVGRGKDIEEKEPVNGVTILERLKSNEEIVFEYGKEIWITK